MSGFHEVLLPLALAIGTSGGPERLTDVVRLASGMESRNARWSSSRRRWEVGGATIRTDLAHELVSFFEARRGRIYGFRFRDPVDWKSCAPGYAISALDQPLGIGDGTTTVFQLVKRYSSGGEWVERRIAKPVGGAVMVALNGVASTAFDVDLTSGLVTLESAPGEGVFLTAGYSFDVPVRFDSDRKDIALARHDAVRVMRTPLVEVAG